MKKKIHIIQLTGEEYYNLTLMVKTGIERAQVITRARVLLLAHEGKIDKEIAGIFSLSTKTPYEIRKRYHTGGLERALYDRPSKQLLKETREPVAAKRGRIAKTDYEYKRNGTCNLFVAVEPKGNKRRVRVTRRRTGKDWAFFIRYLIRHVYRREQKDTGYLVDAVRGSCMGEKKK